MYLNYKTFLVILIVGLAGVGMVITTAFTGSSSTTVATSTTPGGRIALIPLSPLDNNSARGVYNNPQVTSTEEPIIPTPEAMEPQSSPEPTKPTIKAASAGKPVITQIPKTATSQPTKFNCSSSFVNEFLCLLNEYRASKGLGKISGSSSLSKVALSHSSWMDSTGIFSHTGENDSRLGDRCKAAGIICRAENLAHNADTPQKLLNMWVASPSHNTNLLGGYSAAGLAISGSYITLLLN